MRRAGPLLTAAFLATAALAAHAFDAPLHGQIVKGRVLLAGTEQPLSEVHVQLRFPDGRTAASMMTDTSGTFRLHAPRLGGFTLLAERIGFAGIESPVTLNVSEELEVELHMAEEAVPLEPLVVKGRAAIDIGFLAGYYQRVDRHERMGFGHIITRDRIQERQALDVADLLRDIPRISVVETASRTPSIIFRGSRGECIPKVYINGVRQNRGGLAAGTAAVVDETVRPHELEGVEVYHGISEMPPEFYDEGHCGVILLWTRRDTEGGRPFSWIRIILAVGGLAAMGLLLMR